MYFLIDHRLWSIIGNISYITSHVNPNAGNSPMTQNRPTLSPLGPAHILFGLAPRAALALPALQKELA